MGAQVMTPYNEGLIFGAIGQRKSLNLSAFLASYLKKNSKRGIFYDFSTQCIDPYFGLLNKQ